MSGNPFNDHLLEALLNQSISGRGEWVLLQAGPSFFAYEHVLNALKTCQIPLTEYILHPPKDPASTGAVVKDVDCPIYLHHNPQYNLSFLLRDYPEDAAPLDPER